MPNYTAEQKKLLLELFQTARNGWYYDRLRHELNREMIADGFGGLAGDMKHVDPDKAKKDRFGKYLFELKESCERSHKAAFDYFRKLKPRAIEIKIPPMFTAIMEKAEEVCDKVDVPKIKKRAKSIRIEFEQHDRASKQMPIHELSKRLNAEIKGSSQQEANALWRAIEAANPEIKAQVYREKMKRNSRRKRIHK